MTRLLLHARAVAASACGGCRPRTPTTAGALPRPTPAGAAGPVPLPRAAALASLRSLGGDALAPWAKRY